MSYPPDASRSCHEADGRSDRSGGSGGATSSSGGGVYGTLCSNLGGKWSIPVSTASTATISRELMINPSHHVSSHDRLVSNWKRWSLGLDYLLQDSEGVALFKTYLHYEGCSNLLDFWFACQGFRSKVDPADHRKITQLIKVIYRTYIRGSGTGTIGMTNVSLPGQLTESQSNPNVLQSRTEPIRLRAETKRMISERISRKHSLDQSVFDPAQTEVEHFLRTTAYPAFLKSDVYIDFLQSAIDGSTYKFAPNQDTSARAVAVGWPTSTCSNNNAGFPGGIVSHPPGGKFLPTLEEDRELRSDDLPCYSIQSGHTQTVQTPGACAVPHQQPQLHCLHCSQYHSQGHSICPPPDRSNPWLSQLPHPIPPGLRSLGPATNQPNLFAPMTTTATTAVGATSTAPLNAEVPQLTRFYRAELSMQQQAFITQTGGSSNVMRMTHQPVDFFSRRPYPHVPCDLTAGSSRPLAPYVHTHWTDALCPPSVPLGDLCGSRLPTQPPNPYHISYAPVSARDSERHSLSSEARTDDTHSHTDSSHDGTTTRLWKCSFGHRYAGQMPKPPITQTHSPADLPSTTAVTVHHTSRNPSTTTATVVQCGVLGPGSSSALLSPKLGEDGGHIQTNRIAAHRSTATEPSHQPELTDSSKSHGRHARRAVRRSGNAGGWRSGDRSGRGGTVTGPGDLLIGVNATGASVPSKSVTRSHNLAERDPQAFFRILSDKLQRVLDNQTATERLDQLMIESSPNADQSADEPAHPDRSESTHRSRTESHHLPQTDPVATSVVDSGKTVDMTTSATVTVAMSTTTENTRPHTTITATALLRRPWADRLLAAARSQQDSTRDNAQVRF
ncbi:hypothetical protein FGIG_01053 [Fasciola gigantica]|uniref:RGS domain-containing protein n=1 Tax=Fasciola gigantica TaxID=46835 RepID=A0A504YZV5_FASGI|nr:hypothetical protein FGIG_01053 [Fasciola gigantica]